MPSNNNLFEDDEEISFSSPLKEGVDYYIDKKTGFRVMTELYLDKRGYCCNNGCRHCPYSKSKKKS